VSSESNRLATERWRRRRSYIHERPTPPGDSSFTPVGLAGQDPTTWSACPRARSRGRMTMVPGRWRDPGWSATHPLDVARSPSIWHPSCGRMAGWRSRRMPWGWSDAVCPPTDF